MSPKPLISVVIIFLDAGTFLQEAIESVFAQTYSQWELLLVDDGSSDGSSNIAAGWAQRHPQRVRYLEHAGHRNRGMSATRNLGIANARGTFIAFLDADDVWLPHKLDRQVAILESHPRAALVYGPAFMWYGWTGDALDLASDHVLHGDTVMTDTLVEPPVLLALLIGDKSVPPFPSGTLVRRTVIEKVGGFDERFRGMFEDWVFYAKVYLETPVFVSSECLFKHRHHQRACTIVAWNTGQGDVTRLTFLEWLAAYLWGRGVRQGEIWKVLRGTPLGPYRSPTAYRFSKLERQLLVSGKVLLKVMARRVLPAAVRQRLRAQMESNRHSRAVRRVPPRTFGA
jgi:glycosyltransferase involved in cell wall biosynthesis